MEMNDRDQTRDFMNVESFAQLPFIRPSPPLKERGNGGGIRLFGKDFGGNNCKNSTQEENHLSESCGEKNGKSTQEGEESAKYSGNNNADSTSNNRKFECHYCCRNFPTSQALGGHQNAHKRERQQAKRAHLQSVMVHNGLAHHHHHDAHVYGMMNYNRSTPAISMGNYHSWNNMISSNSASYGSSNSRVLHGGHGLCNNSAAHHHQPQPINGSPLALWRIPGGNNSSSSVLTREHSSSTMPQQFRSFDSKDESRPFSSMSSAHDSQSRIGYLPKPGTMKDQVSLDLRL